MHAEKVLRILHVEDSALDAELVRAALEEQGISASWVQVQNRDDFLRAMESGEYDLIISDYSMPSFDGLTALSLAKEKKPEVPFIYLSGTIGEERAVEALQNGATDYVLKDRMFRLGAVIRRSMRDAALRAQKRLVEEQLHTTFARLQQLMAASPTIIYSAPFPPGPLASFVSENVRSWFGYDPEEFVRSPDFWMSRVHPEDKAGMLSRLQALGREEPGSISYRFQHADGTWRWVEDHMNLVRDEAGRPREIVGSWTDITDARRMQEDVARMEQQFHQAQKLEAIGSLAGGVAHDFNNILMVILSYSGFILGKLPKDSPLRREVEEIQKAGNRAADLTHQLLAFSRKETVNPRSFDPREAVQNLSKMLARLIGDNITLNLELGREPGFIFCDPSQFDQVLINLVVNARDAMPGGGQIDIEILVTPHDECCISVKDTGTGMSREVMSRIFEPFFTTKPAGQGTGLGLSMVYGAVQQNKGRIIVESEVGKGTTDARLFQARGRSRNRVGASQAGGGAAGPRQDASAGGERPQCSAGNSPASGGPRLHCR